MFRPFYPATPLGKRLHESQVLYGGGGEEEIPCLCRESDPGSSPRNLGHYADWAIPKYYRNAFSDFVIWWTELTVLRFPRRYLCAVCMCYLAVHCSARGWGVQPLLRRTTTLLRTGSRASLNGKANHLNYCLIFILRIYMYIQGVPGGMCQTSGGCFLC